ncbi:MAG: sensor histidine kinase, partial [Clostridia bacterium]
MFKKTQNRLVTLNVIVFILLLYGLGSALYWTMQYQLYTKADKELLKIASRLSDAPPPHPKLERKRFPDVDRRIVFLFWNGQGQILGK